MTLSLASLPDCVSYNLKFITSCSIDAAENELLKMADVMCACGKLMRWWNRWPSSLVASSSPASLCQCATWSARAKITCERPVSDRFSPAGISIPNAGFATFIREAESILFVALFHCFIVLNAFAKPSGNMLKHTIGESFPFSLRNHHMHRKLRSPRVAYSHMSCEINSRQLTNNG